MPTNPSEEKDLQLTIDDVALCRDNARRLRSDASRSSAPTRPGLLELSIEECAKGFLILFEGKIRREGADLRNPESFEKITDSGVRSILEKHRGVLTPDAVRQAFWSHEVKLAHLEFLIDYLSYNAPKFAELSVQMAIGDPRLPFRQRMRILLTLGNKRNRAEAVSQSREELQELRDLELETLDELKEDGFYVNLSEDGTKCVPPSADEDELEYVDWASSLVCDLLDSMLTTARTGALV
jgi:hypothetical protein